jgi:hypothetical protein
MEASRTSPGVCSAEYVCEVRIESHEDPVLLDRELNYALVTCSGKTGLNHRERIISLSSLLSRIKWRDVLVQKKLH